MSEKEEAKLTLIQGGKEDITDQEFQVFIDAFFGGYKGGGYNPE